MSECLHCRALSSLSDQKNGYWGVLSIEVLKKGSSNDCQSCAIITEAVGIFLIASERDNLQEVWIHSGDNGLLELSMWGTNLEGEYRQIKLCEIFTLPSKDLSQL